MKFSNKILTETRKEILPKMAKKKLKTVDFGVLCVIMILVTKIMLIYCTLHDIAPITLDYVDSCHSCADLVCQDIPSPLI